MRLILTIVFSLFFMIYLAGCKHEKVLQRSVEKTTQSDSTTKVTNTKTDSSYYREQVLQKKLEAAHSDLVLSKEQIVSLLETLKNAPKGTTIYKTDPKLQALLSIVMDSLGNYRFRCESAERTYNETIITQGRIIKELRDSLSASINSSRETEKKVVEPKKTFFETVYAVFQSVGSIVILGVVMALIAFKIFSKG